MKTVQVAIENQQYAESLRSFLLRDGTHRVYVVNEPDPQIDGVIVVDGSKFEHMHCGEPERFVVIARKGCNLLSRLWDAGIRHVIFDTDSPNTAQLAIIAAELRLPSPGPKGARSSVPVGERHHTGARPDLPVLDTAPRCGRCTGTHKYNLRGF